MLLAMSCDVDDSNSSHSNPASSEQPLTCLQLKKAHKSSVSSMGARRNFSRGAKWAGKGEGAGGGTHPAGGLGLGRREKFFQNFELKYAF
jgi:hypothetical protein